MLNISKENIEKLASKICDNIDSEAMTLGQIREARARARDLYDGGNGRCPAIERPGASPIKLKPTGIITAATDAYVERMYGSLVAPNPMIGVRPPVDQRAYKDIDTKEALLINYMIDETKARHELYKLIKIAAIEGTALCKLIPRVVDDEAVVLIDVPGDQSTVVYPVGYEYINSKIKEKNIPWIAQEITIGKSDLKNLFETGFKRGIKCDDKTFETILNDISGSTVAFGSSTSSSKIHEPEPDQSMRDNIKLFEVQCREYVDDEEYYLIMYVHKPSRSVIYINTIQDEFRSKVGKLFWYSFTYETVVGQLSGVGIPIKTEDYEYQMRRILFQMQMSVDRSIDPLMVSYGTMNPLNALVEWQNNSIAHANTQNVSFMPASTAGNLPLNIYQIMSGNLQTLLSISDYTFGRDSQTSKSGQSAGAVKTLVSRDNVNFNTKIKAFKSSLMEMFGDFYTLLIGIMEATKKVKLTYDNGNSDWADDILEVTKNEMRVNPQITLLGTVDDYDPDIQRQRVFEVASMISNNPLIIRGLNQEQADTDIMAIVSRVFEDVVRRYKDYLPSADEVINIMKSKFKPTEEIQQTQISVPEQIEPAYNTLAPMGGTVDQLME